MAKAKLAQVSRKFTFTEQELAAITRIQAESGVSRKTAIGKMRKGGWATPKPAPTVTVEQAIAAQDRVDQAVTKAKAAKPEPVKLTPEQVGANRKEGIRLFALAGRPTRAQFQTVFGKRGDLMTWTERAKTAGLASAEDAAAKFQKLLAKAK